MRIKGEMPVPAETEYESLRAEINQNSQTVAGVFTASVAVSVSLVGYGLSRESAGVLLAPFGVVVPALFFIASQLESTTRIAAYLSVFLEEGEGWESRWRRLREKRMLPRQRVYAPSIAGMYLLLALLCLVLAWLYWRAGVVSFLAVALLLLVPVVAGVVSLTESFSMRMVREYVEAWERLREDERKEGA